MNFTSWTGDRCSDVRARWNNSQSTSSNAMASHLCRLATYCLQDGRVYASRKALLIWLEIILSWRNKEHRLSGSITGHWRGSMRVWWAVAASPSARTLNLAGTAERSVVESSWWPLIHWTFLWLCGSRAIVEWICSTNSHSGGKVELGIDDLVLHVLI